jgi:HD-GYP domain-containing protein (c-di-GMP phosphodiesterase class II)
MLVNPKRFFELGEKFVKITQKECPPGIIGPFALQGAIDAIAKMVEMRDSNTAGHQHKVARLSMAIAREMNLPEEQVKYLGIAATVHDIGKIGIHDEILNKRGELTAEEWEVVKAHPQLGATIVSRARQLAPCIAGILYHHERYDGTGYPDGLVGDNIPLGARLLAVADAFDSMTSDRAYRSAISTEDAINELYKHRGTQFCPIAVEAVVSGLKTHFIKST